jgi:hypothetical protein
MPDAVGSGSDLSRGVVRVPVVHGSDGDIHACFLEPAIHGFVLWANLVDMLDRGVDSHD